MLSVAFTRLKVLFSPTPILCHPDPARQFVVEVDASDTGVGAVLSQRSAEDGKLYPCAFFSRRLSPAERNYDARNRSGVLALVLAFQEWRHWLEGAAEPFLVWTDHKKGPRTLSQTLCRVSFRLILFDRTPSLSLLRPVWSAWFVGRWRSGYGRPSVLPLTLAEPHLTPCLCLRPPAQRFCSGLTLRGWRVTPGWPVLFTSSASASGGHPCPATQGVLSRPAPFVPGGRPHTRPLRVSFIPCPRHDVPGPTSPWILSRVFHLRRVTPSYSL